MTLKAVLLAVAPHGKWMHAGTRKPIHGIITAMSFWWLGEEEEDTGRKKINC